MVSAARTEPWPFPAVEAWPPHDTEESVLGTNLHQTTIKNVRWGINEAARIGLATGQPLPWQALSQILLLGGTRPDGSYYRTLPDIFVYPRPIDPTRSSLVVAVDGPPVLIVEVLSESTHEADLDLVRGKGYSYARAGVPEYLTLDPMGQFIPEEIRAWRLAEEIYRPWEANANGRWQSAQIPVAIGLEGTLATMYAPDGRRMRHEGEIEEERERARAELARRDAELARKDAELARLRRLLAEQQGRK